MTNITLNATHVDIARIDGSLKAACQYCAENQQTLCTVVTPWMQSTQARLTKLVPEQGGEWNEEADLWKWPNGSMLVVSEAVS